MLGEFFPLYQIKWGENLADSVFELINRSLSNGTSDQILLNLHQFNSNGWNEMMMEELKENCTVDGWCSQCVCMCVCICVCICCVWEWAGLVPGIYTGCLFIYIIFSVFPPLQWNNPHNKKSIIITFQSDHGESSSSLSYNLTSSILHPPQPHPHMSGAWWGFHGAPSHLHCWLLFPPEATIWAWSYMSGPHVVRLLPHRWTNADAHYCLKIE